jgi:TonB-linked SusC/RagA family outer membrane protein
MTKQFHKSICPSVIFIFLLNLCLQLGIAQTPGASIKGVILESGTGLPLKQVAISVSSTGVTAETDEKGTFTINVPNNQTELIIYLPGYNKRSIYINSRDSLMVSLVPSQFKSLDNTYNTPLGTLPLKEATYSVSALNSSDLKTLGATSFDQGLQDKVPGLLVVQQSGMPGHKSWINIRGISSLYCKNEPLLFVDGMIHEHNYSNYGLVEGFSLNPLDILDIDDISDVSILKNGESYLGGVSSNGVININTEQKAETSTIINFTLSTGFSTTPKRLDVLDANEYKGYLNKRLAEDGYSSEQINSKYPWLNGDASSKDYYRYNNSTNWQDEIFQPSIFQKYHLFLKGGDDIATYNISVGFLKNEGLYDKSKYDRFNLRINGKINITNKFSVAPNAKLSLSDSYLPNQGPSVYKNPVLSAVLMTPNMTTNARNSENGKTLPYLDDVGAFNISNPVAVTKTSFGSDRNYHFLSSVNIQYKFNEHFIASNLIGISFNSTRESIFLPDKGLVQIDSAANSPADFINDFRSTQNHTMLAYTNKTATGHAIDVKAGFKYMENSYKHILATDVNTPSDDFKSLGQGSKYPYLRSSIGDNYGLLWISYFGAVNYNFQNKYFVNGNLSYDGNSNLNSENRFNLFPSLGAAWSLSSEKFMSQVNWIEDLKLRASWSLSGNMYSSIYDYSKLYYSEVRLDNIGVLAREIIPNENMEIEKKSTIDAGIDLSLFKQVTNLHLDFYQSNVNNLIIEQKLPQTFGFTNYFDNGGKFTTKGIEIAADQRIQVGQLKFVLGASFTKQISEVKSLTFLDKDQEQIITTVEGAEYVTSVGNPINCFYGYKTNGIYNDAGEANSIVGPKGQRMQRGDIRYVDSDLNSIIDEKDKTIIGDPNPDIFGGLSLSVTYKRFELSTFFTYSIGNDVFNYVKYKGESMDTYANQFSDVLNRWTPDNTSASIPRASLGDPTGNTAFSDRWIEDGSFMRLKQLTLNYTLPNTKYYKGVSIYLTATNLLTISGYSGYDPEFMYTNDPFYMGIDYGMMPQVKSFILGLKLDL